MISDCQPKHLQQQVLLLCQKGGQNDANKHKRPYKRDYGPVESGIRDVFESGKYETYLKTMSRFHSYSMSNTMLIYMQKPDATHVAGYHSWQQKFNRCVMKGQKGIRILAPAPYQKTVTMLKGNPVLKTTTDGIRTLRKSLPAPTAMRCGRKKPKSISSCQTSMPKYAR